MAPAARVLVDALPGLRQLAGFGQAKLESEPPLGGADTITRFVGDDAQQPWPRLGAGPEPVERAVGFDEAFLGGVFRFGGRPRDHVGGPESNLLIAAHDLLIGGRIPALGASEQLGIVLRSALHRNALNTPRAASWFPA